MNEDIKEGYPLQWPVHWPRIPKERRVRANFKTSFSKARDSLLNELRLMGAKYPVISSNLALKRDGFPYSNQVQPEETGVTIYFTLFGKQQCIPCDKWTRIEDNIHAINLTVKSLRGLERWGSKHMVEASFKGFIALPSSVSTAKSLYFTGYMDKEEAKKRYRELAKELHPDKGGIEEDFIEMERQYNQLQ